MSRSDTVWYKHRRPPIVGRSFRCGEQVLIDGHGQITIGNFVFLGHRVMVLTGMHDPERRGAERQQVRSARPVTLEDGVWVCSGAIICPGVTVGKHSVVGPGAVVMRNVAPYSIVAGNPARLIRRIKRDDED